jgi:glycosyltransferase involved in cell wall biosynthesis
MKNADLSIVLSDFNRRDAEKLMAKKIVIVSGGIPDPCPQFAEKILPLRRARIDARKKILAGEIPGDDSAKTVNVLYVALVSREKGVFDAIEGVALANEKSPLRFRITVIGGSASGVEEKELSEFIAQRGLQDTVEILGFVSDARKMQALHDADVFCFPTYYSAENQPGNLIEAMAFGLPIVTTRWRSIPEMLPENYPGIVNPKSPEQIAGSLALLAARDCAGPLREIFLRRFTFEQHIAKMAESVRSVEPI